MPTLDVDQLGDILDRLGQHPVAVAAGLCTRQRHRLSTCTRCVDVCPVGAVAFSEGLQIDWEVCTGCGICAAVCPTAALEASVPSNEELLAQIQGLMSTQDAVAFACPRAQGDAQGRAACLTVSCLGRLDESLLVGAVAYGAQAVWLVDGACEGCPQASGRAVAEATITRANALLEAFDTPARAAFRPELPAPRGKNGSGTGVSRRGLFKVLARETARVGEIAVETMPSRQRNQDTQGRPTGDLPKELPGSRLLLLAALKRLGSPAAAALVCESAGPFAQFQLGEGCTGCQMCAFFCPTGALSRVVEDGRIGLAFRTSHCTNCGLCRDICYRDAALLSPQLDLNKLVTLAVDWCFAQEMDAEPWKNGLGERLARQLLGALD
jgi:ferredoxin